MFPSIYRCLTGLLFPLVFLSAAPLPAQETTATATAVVEKPEPLPPRGKEVGRPPRGTPAAKHGHRNRVTRSQALPAYLPASKLKSMPYSVIGFVSFLVGADAYEGSGTVVHPKSTLTAAHILWTPGVGWSTNVKFFRARYGGSYASRSVPNHLYIHGKYMPNANAFGQDSAYTFAWDIGWMTYSSAVAGGGYAGYARKYAALTGTNYCIAVGYGGGTYPKYCEPSQGYYSWNNTAYFLNDSYDHEGGMSGGPIFSRIKGSLYETAVVVSSGGGVRAIDNFVFDKISRLP